MKRRQVLLAGLAGLGGIVLLRAALSSAQSAIIKVLHKQLAYLKLEESGVRQFARDLAVHQVISPSRLRIIDAAGALYTTPALDGHSKLDDAVRHGEERVTTLYLLSSDFFKNGADLSREVRYLGYYDPMVACNNPFARRLSV